MSVFKETYCAILFIFFLFLQYFIYVLVHVKDLES